MDAPSGLAAVALAHRIAAPQALDQRGGRHAPPYHVLLPLLLLHLERKAGAEDAGGQREEGDARHGGEAGDELALPGDGHGVAVANGAQSDDAPPEGVGEAGNVLVLVLLDEIEHEGGEDENEEVYVERGEQFLVDQGLLK